VKELLEYSKEGLALVAVDTLAICSANWAFYFLTGSAPDSIGANLSDTLPLNLSTEIGAHFRAHKDAWSQEATLKPRSGRPIPVRISAELVDDADASLVLLIRIIDISELKKQDLLMKSVGSMLSLNEKRIAEAQRNFKSMLDLLPQGFLHIDSEGIIHQDHSIRVESIFDEPVAGRQISVLLGFSADEASLLSNVFSGQNPQVCLDALPHELRRGDKTLEIAYTPIIEDGVIASVMLAIHDVTEARTLREALERNSRLAKTLYAILSARSEFIELLELVDSLENSLDEPMEIRRVVHTLKGGFSFLECDELADLCHASESAWKSRGYTDASGREFISSIREAIETFLKKHDGILRIRRGETGHEIILERDRLLDLYRSIRSSPIQETSKTELLELIESLLSPKLEESLNWLQKVWVDTLSKTSKPESDIYWEGSVGIFPKPYQNLFRTFVHIVRNAAAHGIESPDERVKLGKSPAGRLTISASLRDTTYRICFTDDGGGIQPGKIIQAAQKRGKGFNARLDDREIIQMVFDPDFSTAGELGDVAGLGLGLYIVRHEAILLGGTAEVSSELGTGTTITVTFPKQPVCDE
jgi:two-component system chemotaxis sensor kinase CheA